MSGRKPKEIKKAQYYVWYLGWRECRGVWGREFTEPIARDLLHTRRGEELPKLTLEVSRKELKIVQLMEKKKGKTEKIKYPPIPAKDVTYAVQVLSPDEDVVACIYLGYNPQTRCAVHVHVYRCDSLETAGILTAHLNQLIELPEHQQRVHKIEQELVAKGQVVPRPNQYGRFINNNSDGHSTTRTSSSDGDQDRGDIYNQQQQRPPRSPLMSASREEQNEPGPTPGALNLYDTLAAELRAKLGSKDNQPILLPPKDYDTVHRSKGKLINLDDKKATNEKVVGDIGAGGVMLKPFKHSSGEDSARGDSDNGSYGRNSQNGEQGGGSEIAAAVQSMPWPTIQVEEDRDDRGSAGGSDRAHGYPYYSNGVPEDPYDVRQVPEDPYDVRRVPEDPYDVRPGRNARPPVSPRSPRRLSPPRQERSARRDLSPGIPRGPRGGSPMPLSRELSPVRYQPAVGPPSSSGGGRPMSPPPELRDSYFPNKGLPNYLASDGDLYNTSAVFDHRLPSRGAGRGGGVGGGGGVPGGPRYTASSLGLTDRGGGVPGGSGGIMRNPSSRDEGYRSMDRQDNHRPLSGQYYDNPYAASMDRLNRPGPGAGHMDPGYPPPQGPGYKRENPRRGYDEMPPPDYAMRGGGGFDYLP